MMDGEVSVWPADRWSASRVLETIYTMGQQ